MSRFTETPRDLLNEIERLRAALERTRPHVRNEIGSKFHGGGTMMIGALERPTKDGLSFESADGRTTLRFERITDRHPELGRRRGIQIYLDGSWLNLSPPQAIEIRNWLDRDSKSMSG